MPIKKWISHGKVRLVISKQWPDGTRLRREAPNRTAAKALLSEIETSIFNGTWRKKKEELQRRCDAPAMLKDLIEPYLKYCESRGQSMAFKNERTKMLQAKLGNVRLDRLNAAALDGYVASRRTDKRADGKQIKAATINRDLAVLGNMLNWAIQRGLASRNPVSSYQKLIEEEMPRRILRLEEYHKLLKAISIHPAAWAFCVVLGETGLRRSEALRLCWSDIDRARSSIVVGQAKSKRGRLVPLSDFALEAICGLTRSLKRPQIFINQRTGRPYSVLRKPLETAAVKAELSWIKGFHDFRHFRLTLWLANGVDIRTVQQWAGHENLQTTMGYVHYLEEVGREAFLKSQEVERAKLEKKNETGAKQERKRKTG